MGLFEVFRTHKNKSVHPLHVKERLDSRWTNYGQLICLRSGNKKDLHTNTLMVAEIGYCNDTNEYFIGTENGYESFDNFKLLATNLYIERGNRCFIGLDKLGYEKFLNRKEA